MQVTCLPVPGLVRSALFRTSWFHTFLVLDMTEALLRHYQCVHCPCGNPVQVSVPSCPWIGQVGTVPQVKIAPLFFALDMTKAFSCLCWLSFFLSFDCCRGRVLGGWVASLAGRCHGTDGDPAVLSPGHCWCNRPVPCPVVHLSVRPCCSKVCPHG